MIKSGEVDSKKLLLVPKAMICLDTIRLNYKNISVYWEKFCFIQRSWFIQQNGMIGWNEFFSSYTEKKLYSTKLFLLYEQNIFLKITNVYLIPQNVLLVKENNFVIQIPTKYICWFKKTVFSVYKRCHLVTLFSIGMQERKTSR